MKILAYLLISCIYLLSANLSKSGNYVKDTEHNLLWQDQKANVVMLGSQVKAVEYCEALSLGGYSNWRLPTVDEYKYIIDKTRTDELMINRSFSYILPEGYWTQDRTWRTFGRYGYYIYFKSGTAYYENRTYPKFFRCVRDSN